jgi:hypothetical protein
MATIDTILENHKSNSFDEQPSEQQQMSKVEKLRAYVDECFEKYDIVSDNLDRDRIGAHIADWNRRRGQCRYNKSYSKAEFGGRVTKKHETYTRGKHSIFIATALVGVPPKDDKGVGWKACVRHELGHAIDYEQRGRSDHSAKFKAVMSKFDNESNDGGYAHGYRPDVHK